MDELAETDSVEGNVHGRLCKNFFGVEPSEMMEEHRAVFGGFAIMKGEFKINSWTFNAPQDSEYHDNMK